MCSLLLIVVCGLLFVVGCSLSVVCCLLLLFKRGVLRYLGKCPFAIGYLLSLLWYSFCVISELLFDTCSLFLFLLFLRCSLLCLFYTLFFVVCFCIVTCFLCCVS